MMSFSSIQLLATVLLVGGKQFMVGASQLTGTQCQESGGFCVPPGNCSSPSWSNAVCEGQGEAAVCCNPSTKQAFQETLHLDGFAVDFKINPCSNKKCLQWYKGFWTNDVALCTPKQRIVNYCANTNEWCCAPRCRRKSRCSRRGGYCVPRKSYCPGRARHRLCGGKMCFCCLPPWPVPDCPCPQNSVSVCSTSPYALADNTCVQVHSPKYPNAYDDNTDCSLQVVAAPYCTLTVQYCEVTLETCPFDFLNVSHSGGSDSYCGAVSPPSFTTTGNTVQFDFTTDFSQQNRGFQVYVASNCSCGTLPTFEMCTDTTITTSVGGVLVSPGYPGNYPPVVDCSVQINAPAGSVINFQYIAFSLEGSFPSCSFDYVQVYDTATPDLTKYCGTTAPTLTTSNTNQVTVNFFSDKDFVSSGFEICFTVSGP